MKKEDIPEQMRNEKHFLYNHVVERLLNTVITAHSLSVDDELTLVASRRETNKHLNVVFTKHIQQRASQNHGVVVGVSITPPASEKSLQVADILAWAVFQKYENEDNQYCGMLGEKVSEVFYS